MKYIVGIYDGSFPGDQRTLADWDEAVSLACALSADTGIAYGIWQDSGLEQSRLLGPPEPVRPLVAIAWQREVYHKHG